jgi:S1-C subfamily serine protease
VPTGSPAATAGIEPGDVITKLGSTTIAAAALDSTLPHDHAPGEAVTVTIVRAGRTLTPTAKLTER